MTSTKHPARTEVTGILQHALRWLPSDPGTHPILYLRHGDLTYRFLRNIKQLDHVPDGSIVHVRAALGWWANGQGAWLHRPYVIDVELR